MFFCHLFKGKQILQLSGSGRSKLLKSLVNVSLNFQTFITQICQYFCQKNLRSLAVSIFQQKISVYLDIKS